MFQDYKTRNKKYGVLLPIKLFSFSRYSKINYLFQRYTAVVNANIYLKIVILSINNI